MPKPVINLGNLFSYETLVHAISGAVGGFTAMATFYPLDMVRSKYQLEDSRKAKSTLEAIKEIINEEGV
jgi:PREDICTED: similar to CG32250-PA